MHQALYRKWRPSTFDDVCGQEHVSSVLKYEVANAKLSHAYLFCGSRGTGKTSCAKILAKAINCERSKDGNPCGECDACRAIEAGTATDVLEMDAASNNGVENIRDIRDEVVYTPSALKYRVYIVDEVHMLSPSAFNALLKTLEEPPAHVVFILATTELHKLPATIISRCQRFDFRRISTPVITERLMKISSAEGFEIEKDAAALIAKISQGGMRDSISLLELCSGKHKKITKELVNEAIGSTGRDSIVRTVKAIAEKNYDKIFEEISNIATSSKDISVFWQELINFYRDMFIFKTTSAAEQYLDLTGDELEQLADVSSSFGKEAIMYHSKLLDEAFTAMQRSNALKRSVAEMTLVRMCDLELDASNEALLARIASLEEKIATGQIVTNRQTQNADTEIKQAEKPKEAPKKADKQPTKENPQKEAPAAEPEEKSGAPLSYWRDAIDKIVKNDRSVIGFIEKATAKKAENGKIVIEFDNSFAYSIATRESSKCNILSILSGYEGKEMSEQTVKFTIKGKEKNEHSPLDEIM